jgi:hypothetical protein
MLSRVGGSDEILISRANPGQMTRSDDLVSHDLIRGWKVLVNLMQNLEVASHLPRSSFGPSVESAAQVRGQNALHVTGGHLPQRQISSEFPLHPESVGEPASQYALLVGRWHLHAFLRGLIPPRSTAALPRVLK